MSDTRSLTRARRRLAVLACLALLCATPSLAQTVTIDTSPAARQQTLDGFGTCLSGSEASQNWWRALYFDDLQCSLLRLDLTPHFKAPYNGMNGTYNSPWYHNNPALPGPDQNDVRVYTNAADYRRTYNGWVAPIAVMGPDINQNTNYFDFRYGNLAAAGALARLGAARSNQLGDFKLFGSLWSPAPWVKVASGNLCPNWGGLPMPLAGTPWPFIWYDNFAGGKLDTTGVPVPDFDDSTLGGNGPTSALTQFARGIAAYLRGFQSVYGVRFYSISIQNELNFEEFYSSCTYPLSPGYIAALKAVRAELDKYPDLAPIQLMGPEDLLGGDVWGMWQYGGGATTIHKNLQYLQNLAADPQALAAEAFFCIHGYAADGVSAANATPTCWNWWANGWSSSPTPGIPPNVQGFNAFGKKSWMTETSGEDAAWLAPASGFPNQGAWSLALRLHQALTTGRESAWAYWQLTDGQTVGASTLTDSLALTNSPKYVAAKHFFRFLRPGAVRVGATVSDSTNLLASAWLHETNQTLALVLLNTSSNPLSAHVQLPGQSPALSLLRTFTSADGSLWQTSTAAVTNGAVSIAVPGFGLVTLYDASPTLLTASLVTPGTVTLSWSQAGAGWTLQSTGNPMNGWSAEIAPVSYAANGRASVLANPGARPRFYRLALP